MTAPARWWIWVCPNAKDEFRGRLHVAGYARERQIDERRRLREGQVVAEREERSCHGREVARLDAKRA